MVSRQCVKDRIKIAPSYDNNKILQIILKSWDNLIQLNRLQNVRKISISLHGLQKQSGQLSFGDLNNQRKQQHLSNTIDLLNQKLGGNVVTIGVSPNQNTIKPIIAFGHIPTKQGK